MSRWEESRAPRPCRVCGGPKEPGRGRRVCVACRITPYVLVASPHRRMYARWRKMISRCTTPKDKDWPNYGGRGITVCDQWLTSFDAYHRDLGDPPFKGASVDRIDNDGNYEPGNVRWATRLEQNRNRVQHNSKKTHCPQDHPYDEENTYIDSRGRRWCRTCNRAAAARYSARKRQQVAA